MAFPKNSRGAIELKTIGSTKDSIFFQKNLDFLLISQFEEL